MVVRPVLTLALCAAALTGCNTFQDARGARSILDIFAGPSTEDAVALALDEYDPDARFRGITLLSAEPAGGSDTALELYRVAADDTDDGVRQAGVRALGLHGELSDAPVLIERLDDESRLVRLAAARALQRIHDPEAVPVLIERTDEQVEPEPVVRAAAAEAMGQYREQRVLQALVRTLDDRSLAVNTAARRSLQTLTGQDLGIETGAWLSWIRQTDDPFQAGQVYTYPGYDRKRLRIEYLPLLPDPPRETPAPPVGMPRGAG
ncbi:MAG: HEAT repeat domain-containing protein [Planctomycetota bacterium]